jgi:predicted RNA-binding protein YlxR (DUF448 family)
MMFLIIKIIIISFVIGIPLAIWVLISTRKKAEATARKLLKENCQNKKTLQHAYNDLRNYNNAEAEILKDQLKKALIELK